MLTLGWNNKKEKLCVIIGSNKKNDHINDLYHKRLDIIKGAGHCPHDEEPEKTNKLIIEFIQETK